MGISNGESAFCDAKNYLSKQSWFYGLVIREDIVQFLQKTGDWLCRYTDSHGFMQIVISLKASDNIHEFHVLGFVYIFGSSFGHVPYVAVNGHYYLALTTGRPSRWYIVDWKRNTFSSVHELITYHRVSKLPCGVSLSSAVPRPDWLISSERLKIKRRIGSGNFAEVYAGTMTCILGLNQMLYVDVAIKACRTVENRSERGVIDELTSRVQMFAEAKLMSKFAHRNVIRLYGFACDEPPIKIVMELCPGGSIRNHLEVQQDEIGDAEKIFYAYEAAKGMRYLHHEGCIHRDLAARNCLIGARGNIKISDFGLSKAAAELQGLKFDSKMHMPVRWMAPETLRRHPRFSVKSDVWAFGVLLYEIFNQGEKPWPEVDFCKIVRSIRRCNMPDPPRGTPSSISKLMAVCWAANPMKRPGFSRLCNVLHLLLTTKFRLPPPCQLSIASLDGVVPDNVSFEESTSSKRTVEDSHISYVPRQLKLNEDDLRKFEDDDMSRSATLSTEEKVGPLIKR
ncbi:unnamed protein product [Toxocara canis]|uniref:non-specific protein-tyrosine kinase n=1 Tax=Toxocara canis TaxID=6265 RepID=A0A183UHR7_TOXCA|nr:unnamed protein product [Toxocara canis]